MIIISIKVNNVIAKLTRLYSLIPSSDLSESSAIATKYNNDADDALCVRLCGDHGFVPLVDRQDRGMGVV